MNKRLWFISSVRPGFRTRAYVAKETAMREAEKLYVYRTDIGQFTPIELFFRSPTKGPLKVGEIGPWGWKWAPEQEDWHGK